MVQVDKNSILLTKFQAALPGVVTPLWAELLPQIVLLEKETLKWKYIHSVTEKNSTNENCAKVLGTD